MKQFMTRRSLIEVSLIAAISEQSALERSAILVCCAAAYQGWHRMIESGTIYDVA